MDQKKQVCIFITVWVVLGLVVLAAGLPPETPYFGELLFASFFACFAMGYFIVLSIFQKDASKELPDHSEEAFRPKSD